MDKRQLIDGIRTINPSASQVFLAQFNENALQQYLQHLQSAPHRGVRIAGWVKQASRQPRIALRKVG